MILGGLFVDLSLPDLVLSYLKEVVIQVEMKMFRDKKLFVSNYFYKQ
jgi:hypothetical protein